MEIKRKKKGQYTDFRKTAFSVLCIFLALSQAVCASDDIFEVHGFGNLTATQTDDPDYIFRHQQQPEGKSNQITLEADSRLGLQLDIAPNERLFGVVQIVAAEGNEGTVELMPEWAFAGYKIRQDLIIKLGRVLTPVFLESENRFINYSQITVRPASTIYNFYPLSSHDGLNLEYSGVRLAGGILDLNAYAGTSRFHAYDSLKGDPRYYSADFLYGTSINWDKKPFVLHVGYLHGDFHVDGTGLTQPLSMLRDGLNGCAKALGNSVCADYADKYGSLLKGANLDFVDIGAKADFDVVTLSAEIFQRNSNSIYQDVYGFNVTSAWVIDDWMHYISYGEVETTSNAKPEAALKNLAAPYAGLGNMVNAVLEAGHLDRDTLAIGTRWDFAPKMDLKLEVMQVRLENAKGRPDAYTADDLPMGWVRDKSFNLYTLTFDFVF